MMREDSRREKLPFWSSQSYRRGVIAIIGERGMEQKLLEVRTKFLNDPLQFFIYRDRIQASSVVAVSRGGTKWTMKPSSTDLDSWLVKVVGGEVRWHSQDEERCPIRYDAR